MTRVHCIIGLGIGVLFIAPSIVLTLVFKSTGIEQGSLTAAAIGSPAVLLAMIGALASLYSIFALMEMTAWKLPTPDQSADPTGIKGTK